MCVGQLKEAKKLLSKMGKYNKKVLKAQKKGGAIPPMPANIMMPPQNLPLPPGDARERWRDMRVRAAHAARL